MNLRRVLHAAVTISLFPLLVAAGPTVRSGADLAWLSGSWQTDGEPRIEEHWTPATANGLLGVGRTVRAGTTVFFEYVRIEVRDDGVFYVAQPLGRPPTEFRLVKLEGQSAEFENPAHDYPKRIVYRRNADGSLYARVEGNGKAEEFAYRPAAD
jgi:hypothetical protein